jgi:hypothetical protein
MKRAGPREANRPLSLFPCLNVTSALRLFDRLRGFVGGNPQRSEKPSIVGGDVERTAWLRYRSPSRCRDLRECGSSRAADKPDDGLECQFHLKPCGARLFSARLHLRILSDRGGNRVGQLSCEPVDDVVHPNSLPTPPGRVPGRSPICLHQGDEPRLGARRVHVFRKSSEVA